MIKLFSLKQKKDGEQTSRTGNSKKASAAQLRIQKGKCLFFFTLRTRPQNSYFINNFMKFFILISFRPLDITNLNLPTNCSTDFPDPDDLLNFKLVICPDEGFYRGGRFTFNFKVCNIIFLCC